MRDSAPFLVPYASYIRAKPTGPLRDGADAAAVEQAGPARPGGTTKLRHWLWRPVPNNPAEGFDTRSRPPWVMVPLHGQKHVRLWRYRGKLLSLEVEDPTVVKVQRVRPTKLLLRGTKEDTTWVHGVDERGQQITTLEVTVKAPKLVYVAFHFVGDVDGTFQTRRKHSERLRLLKRVNDIYRAQTNITFLDRSMISTPADQPTFTLKEPLSDPTTITEGDIAFKKVFAEAVRGGVHVNVFFVWNFDGEALAAERDGLVVMQDIVPGDEALVLAHEFGHYLTDKDAGRLYPDGAHSRSRQDLMFRGVEEGDVVRGKRISRAEANVMNPSGT